MRLLARFFAAVLLILVGAGWGSAQTKNAPSPKPTAVTGSGTTNTIPLWTGSTTIGNSVVTQSGSNVSVGGSITATSLMGDGTGVTNVNAAKLGGFLPSEFAQIGGTPTFVNLNLTDFLALPNTSSSTTGVIMLGSIPFLHNYSAGSLFYNTFVGSNAGNFTMDGGYNTAAGGNALRYNTTGSRNTAIGYEALSMNGTGGNNTATGAFALYYNSTGGRSVASGMGALYNNSTGDSNTAIGYEALEANIDGTANVATGDYSLFRNTSGGFNVAMGHWALYHTTGSSNIGVGSQAGFNLTTGSDNIDIGSAGVAGESDTIRIGTPGIQSTTFIAGISGVPTGGVAVPVLVDGNGQLGTASSSRRFKYDIQDIGGMSDRLIRLRPVAFRYKQAQNDGSHPLQYGLIAEDVAAVYPELVQFDQTGRPQSVLYHLLPVMLLNELQKQRATVDALAEQIDTLKQENAELRHQLQSVLLQVKQMQGRTEEASATVLDGPAIAPTN